MVLGGLWHGAAWSFVLWGAYQGVLAGRASRLRGAGAARARGTSHAWRRSARGSSTLHLVCYGWLLFRARSFEQIRAMTWALLTDWRISPDVAPEAADAGRLRAAAGRCCTPTNGGRTICWRCRSCRWCRATPSTARVFYLILLFGSFGGSQFIYFQF